MTTTTKTEGKTDGNCANCGGTGKTVFRHIENGICFWCDGSGWVESKPSRPARAIKRIPLSREVAILRCQILLNNAKSGHLFYSPEYDTRADEDMHYTTAQIADAPADVLARFVAAMTKIDATMAAQFKMWLGHCTGNCSTDTCCAVSLAASQAYRVAK